MNRACELCRGACCESLVVRCIGDVGTWLRYHGEPIGEDRAELPTPCRMLVDGKCAVWASRPQNCERYEVGGKDCRETVKRRRANWREILEAMA